MDLDGRVALVTGANRGLGDAFARALVDRGATVYAAARRPESVTAPDVRPVRLDVTDTDSVQALAEQTGDVEVLVNNAGILTHTSLLHGSMDAIAREIDTNFYGPLRMIRAFTPQLARAGGGGAVLDVLSVLSRVNLPGQGAYCAAKAAAWSMTNAARQELGRVGIRVTALHVGLIDTEMIRGTAGPKTSPAEVARVALDGLQADRTEIIVDEWTRRVQRELSGGVDALYSMRIG